MSAQYSAEAYTSIYLRMRQRMLRRLALSTTTRILLSFSGVRGLERAFLFPVGPRAGLVRHTFFGIEGRSDFV